MRSTLLSSRSTFFRLHNGVNPFPVFLQIYFITRGMHSFPVWSWGEQSNVCFELPIKRDLMALVRAQEEALDFKRLQMRWQLRLTASLCRTRTAVSSVFLATAAQGLQLDIAYRLRTASVVVQARLPPTAFYRQKCLQRRC